MQLRMHTKAGNKRQLTWSTSDRVFLPSAAFVRRFFFCIFVPLVLLFFVSFFVFYSSPSLVTEMDEDNGAEASMHSRLSLLPGTTKTMATLVLVSVLFLSFCWCSLWRWWGRWWWRRVMLVEFTRLPLCFSAFDSVIVGSLSRYSSLFFFILFFSPPFFSSPVPPSRGGLYSLITALIRKRILH